MKVCTIMSTKGGIGKTTDCATLGAFCADAGIRTLLIDLDMQPSLSSFYQIKEEARGGIYEFLAFNDTRPENVISKTVIDNLSVILSNEPTGQLYHLLLQAPDGRLRLHNLLKSFKDQYDLVLVDTQGARSVVLEMAMLASDIAISPITPDMLAAREFNRGTRQLIQDLQPFAALGLSVPPVNILINRVDNTRNSRTVHEAIVTTFSGNDSFKVLQSTIPDADSFKTAATEGVPPHRLEYRKPSNRVAPSAYEIVRGLAIELFPEWADRLEALTAEKVELLVKAGR